MDAVVKRFSSGYKLACIGDALLLPALFVFWYRGTHSAVASAAQIEAVHRPGILLSTLMMILVWRALLKLETAIRTPEAYRWDLERALPWIVLYIVMGLAIRLLA